MKVAPEPLTLVEPLGESTPPCGSAVGGERTQEASLDHATKGEPDAGSADGTVQPSAFHDASTPIFWYGFQACHPDQQPAREISDYHQAVIHFVTHKSVPVRWKLIHVVLALIVVGLQLFATVSLLSTTLNKSCKAAGSSCDAGQWCSSVIETPHCWPCGGGASILAVDGEELALKSEEYANRFMAGKARWHARFFYNSDAADE